MSSTFVVESESESKLLANSTFAYLNPLTCDLPSFYFANSTLHQRSYGSTNGYRAIVLDSSIINHPDNSRLRTLLLEQAVPTAGVSE